MSGAKSTIPDNISEEYYQISPEILQSFPKYRPPLDLFRFKEAIATLEPYSRKGQRLSGQQVDAIHALCDDGMLFVARSDHPVYSKHIVKQLDLVLVDAHLKESEIADIFMRALAWRLEQFFDQPVQVVFDKLYADIMVLTEYLSKDWHRVKALLKRLHKEHTLVNHSANSGVFGLWLYLKARKGNFKRKDLDRAALAFFLHDMGMVKIPEFIRSKAVPLTQEERQKIHQHPVIGVKMADKLGLTFGEIKACIVEHHERLDGSGYPRKVSGEELSKLGRLCAVADSFTAMISERPYAEAMEPRQAAQALAQDKRYDERFANIVKMAYITGEF